MIEKITGMSYAEVLHQRILSRIDAKRTRYGDLIRFEEDEAYPIFWQGDHWMTSGLRNPMASGSAGAIVSRPTELCVFVRALFAGDPVNHNSLKSMTTLRHRLGRGLIPLLFPQPWVWGHAGDIDGFQAAVWFNPDCELCLSVTQSTGFGVNDDHVISALMAAATNSSIPARSAETVAVSTEQLDVLVGKYESDEDTDDLYITRHGDVLWALWSATTTVTAAAAAIAIATRRINFPVAFPLTPISDTEFATTDMIDARIAFKMLNKKSNKIEVNHQGMTTSYYRSQAY